MATVTPERSRTTALPGHVLIAAAVVACVTLHHLLGGPSPLLTALVVGAAIANSGLVPAALWARMTPAFAFASRHLLRAGIVLLGLQIVLEDVLDLGTGMLALVVVIVVGGIASTLVVGRALRVPLNQRLLIACGFSICGAAAIAGTSDVIEAEEEDIAASIALVALFGTAMIIVIPVAGPMLGLSDLQTGMWAGGSIHEVAQVVAAGGSMGGAALSVAILVKLARVMMLAPVAATLGVWHRRQSPAAASRPKLVPLFVLGFLAMALVRSTGQVPDGVVHTAGTAQLWLLSAAMFAIGCGCRFGSMRRLGWRPVALGALSTLTVAAISYAGIVLLY